MIAHNIKKNSQEEKTPHDFCHMQVQVLVMLVFFFIPKLVFIDYDNSSVVIICHNVQNYFLVFHINN